ncbi:MAG: nickel-dependent lactate racemase [Alphaproteobacteria bacterium]
MIVDILYDKGRLPVRFDDGLDVTVIAKRPMPPIADPAAAIAEALVNPVAAPPLATMAKGARTACILICDITRSVPNHLFLQPLIRTLMAAGVPTAGITVLIATGLHRPNLGAEMAELIGDPWVLQTVKVVNHDARNDDDHVHIGNTPRGTVVRLDRRFVEADIKIATGLVEPHFMAGYSGGRKVIAPGVAHAETITTFHSARFMADPNAANCVLDGNPLHIEQVAIIEMLGGALALNTVIDEDRALAFVNFGEVIASHLAAVAYTRDYTERPIDRQFATIVTSAAGYPLDKTYYQTVKGMVNPMNILASGGDLIIASACSEGMGSPEFVDAQQRLVDNGPDAFMREISAKSHAAVDEWQTQMQLKPMAIGHIHLYSNGLDAAGLALTGVNHVASIEAAVQASVARTGDTRVAVIPEGPYVVPVHRPTA